MKRCKSGKHIYVTQTIAEDVLIDLWSKHDYSQTQGPCAVYLCDECGYYHLTSQGKMNGRLAVEIANGNIRRSREANRWLSRLKKR
jgi:hypothetical protein